MATRPEVLSDIAATRQALRSAGNPHLGLLQLDVGRPIRDVLLDTAFIIGAVSLGVVEPASWPFILLVLGNRQRALGNILHDAAHRNLSRNRRLNDLLAQAVVAPLLFLSLSRYRDLHFRHHLVLGSAEGDPDLIPVPAQKARAWWLAVASNTLSWPTFVGSVFGHLLDSGAPVWARLYIVVWWTLVLSMLHVATDGPTAVASFGLWIAARATAFHLITTFREMCDHHGLQPGGVFSFTRDITSHGAWCLLVHPRNNAYHLTHHLLPAIPYYRLPEAQRLFSSLPVYQSRGRVCDSYFRNTRRAVADWQLEQ